MPVKLLIASDLHGAAPLELVDEALIPALDIVGANPDDLKSGL